MLEFYNVNVIYQQFSDYFTKQMNLQEIFCRITYLKASTNVKKIIMFGEKYGDEAVDHKMDPKQSFIHMATFGDTPFL